MDAGVEFGLGVPATVAAEAEGDDALPVAGAATEPQAAASTAVTASARIDPAGLIVMKG